nr:hypothetical protein [Tanacetum cinerariifolium]
MKKSIRLKVKKGMKDVRDKLSCCTSTHLLKLKEQQKSLHDFTNKLFGTTSLKFSPTPPKEPTPLRDLTKGKEIAIMKEQAKKWTEHKAKEANILEEYNHQISFRVDPLPITKISYNVNLNKEETIKIIRDIKVDGMNKNLIPPPRVMPIEGLVIKEPESGLIRIQNQIKVDLEIADEMFRKMVYVMKEPVSGGLKGNERILRVQSLREQHQTYSSQRHRQGSQRLLEDIFVSWDGYQLRAITKLVYLVEAHHHLNPIIIVKHDGLWRIDDGVVMLVLEARGIPLSNGFLNVNENISVIIFLSASFLSSNGCTSLCKECVLCCSMIRIRGLDATCKNCKVSSPKFYLIFADGINSSNSDGR